MLKIRGLVIDPSNEAMFETFVKPTMAGCSRIVGGFLRFGSWVGPDHALYLSAAPDTDASFAIRDRLVVGKALVIGAASGRRSLQKGATIAISEISPLIRFADLPGADKLIHVPEPAWLEQRFGQRIREPR